MKLLSSSQTCEVCDRPASRLMGVRWQGRSFCSSECAVTVRQAELKAAFDAKDASPTVCRCAGAPAPLEPTGPHCSKCRRMYSAELRLWLSRRPRERADVDARTPSRWVDDLAWQLGLRSTT
jgi:hypothetical protein